MARYGLRPGLGLYHVKPETPAYAEWEAFVEASWPSRKGVPRDPRVAAWKRTVMKKGWEYAMGLIRQGVDPKAAFRRALRWAYQTYPKP